MLLLIEVMCIDWKRPKRSPSLTPGQNKNTCLDHQGQMHIYN